MSLGLALEIGIFSALGIIYGLAAFFSDFFGLITRKGNLGGNCSSSESRIITGGPFFGVGVVGYVMLVSFGGEDTDVSSSDVFGSISKNIADSGFGSFISWSESVLALLSLLISSAERFSGNCTSSVVGTTIGGRTVSSIGFSVKYVVNRFKRLL